MMKTRDRTIEEEIADLQEQIANLQKRLDQLQTLKDHTDDYMTPALRHPGFRQWRERRGRG